MGLNNVNHMAHYSATDGCRVDAAWLHGPPEHRGSGRGGWTEDAWLDVMHSMVDGLEAQEGFC